MNIDDILASVSNTERIPQRTSDLQALTRAWVAERCAPEILPYPEELIDRIMERIKMQVSNRYSFFFFSCFVTLLYQSLCFDFGGFVRGVGESSAERGSRREIRKERSTVVGISQSKAIKIG
jgi:hypothetical protein